MEEKAAGVNYIALTDMEMSFLVTVYEKVRSHLVVADDDPQANEMRQIIASLDNKLAITAQNEVGLG